MGGMYGIHKVKMKLNWTLKKYMIAGEMKKGKNKSEVTIVAQYH